ncbi:ABC-type multidrug transport system, ATPase component [Gottschalkia purinilytica]|uniref:ABC-type multidrug transport system, ATPase component n=1 Tax=Gottschalkia purinilytica TaxID=1503 RepID=A0A0L0W9G9_GOTPU|nr:ABC transporter ATP-binding protein [Gottschalkia purinilytica]KNF08203.1 ABC-type multidrug transport system, ATPase component [Gottschalkia purinilytica]
MSEYIIKTENLTKRFGKFTAVDSINLEVKEGQIYGFLGPNGAGKSTTIRMLLGLIRPTNGSIKIFNKNVTTNNLDILKNIGSLVEYPSYYENLTAFENLSISANILGLKKDEISRVLNIVGLEKWQNSQVKKFSLGMKQRLGIAQALLGNPKLLILDEPTNGLDPAGIQEIRELIKSLPEKQGMTVLVSSHILSEIEIMATHIGIINKGKIHFQGSMEELKRSISEEIQIKTKDIKNSYYFLIKSGYAAEIKGDKICVPSEQGNPEDINGLLVNEGHQVYYLNKQQESLEEIFLNMTQSEVK